MTLFEKIKKIHDICVESNGCSHCPFLLEDRTCGVTDLVLKLNPMPRYWELDKIKEFLDD